MKSQKNILTFKSLDILIEKMILITKMSESKSIVFKTLIF